MPPLLHAAGQPPTKVNEAALQNSKRITTTMRLARYDGTTGLCTAGSVQLLTKAAILERKAAWNEKSVDGGCVDPAKKPVQARALYPVDEKGKHLRGAAHLLLELDEAGAIAAVRPVCATDAAFASAAAVTAAKLAFSPRMCGGKAVRSAILLPFAFDP
ncbi:hypothetical protein [Pseudoxanthomonas gei]|uniref:hypothetical protein n=1 Tax=Pseudoxanthomonas gei TaxID=1383030 RepID=UPI001390E9E1|nr:hypothetical protein [Pseudoxanthomonas gei]